MRWEGPGSGFEGSSTCAGGAQGLARSCAPGIGLKKQGVRTTWDMAITGQTFQGVGLKLQAFILTFRDLASHLCQKKA